MVTAKELIKKLMGVPNIPVIISPNCQLRLDVEGHYAILRTKEGYAIHVFKREGGEVIV
jgi:hypothetical protein